MHIYLCRFGVHLASVTGRWEVVRVLGPIPFDVAFRLCSTIFLVVGATPKSSLARFRVRASSFSMRLIGSKGLQVFSFFKALQKLSYFQAEGL